MKKKPVVYKQRAKGGLYEESLTADRIILRVAVSTPGCNQMNYPAE